MADLTSKYLDKELRDISIQACVNAIDAAFSFFPENYIQGCFTDFFDIQGGTQPPKSQFIHSEHKGYVRFLQIRDFARENTVTYIPVDKKNKLCEEDDVLLGRYGASVGKILTGKAGAYNVACAKVIILNEKEVTKDYLFYLLHSSIIQNHIRNISRSAQGGFNKGDLSKIEVIVPKLKYQKKLFQILGIIENYLVNNEPLVFEEYEDEYLACLIEKFKKHLSVTKEIEDFSNHLDQQQIYLQLLRQTILQEAVQGKLTKQELTDEPATELLKRIKAEKEKRIKAGKLKKEKELPPIKEDEILFELPTGWVWCRLKELGFITGGGTPSTSNTAYWNGNIPWITPKDMKAEFLDDAEDKVTLEGVNNSSAKLIPPNSILVVGRSGILKRTLPVCINTVECVVNQDLKVVVPHLTVMARYIQIMLQGHEEFILQKLVKYGMTVHSLMYQEFEMQPFPLPPLAEQQRIVTKVQQLQLQLNQLEAQVKRSRQYAQELLQSVLKEAFKTGKKQKGDPVAVA